MKVTNSSVHTRVCLTILPFSGSSSKCQFTATVSTKGFGMGGGPISAKHFLGFNNVFCSRSIPWPLRILKGLPSPLEVAWRTRNEARCFEWDNHASSHTTASRGFGGPCVLGVPVSLQFTPPAAPSHLSPYTH